MGRPRTTQSRSTRNADLMDGASYPSTFDKDKTPADFMNGPDGLRQGSYTSSSKQKPWGSTFTDLSEGIKGKTIPPRSIWKEGHWKGFNGDDWYIWVVDGQGTPGNYEKREYRLPHAAASKGDPDHPADWSKKLREEGDGKPKTYGSGSSGSSGSYSTGPTVPLGMRVRCVGCGHFYRMDDLAGHVKTACPAVQMEEMGYVNFVMECACHEDLQDAAAMVPGWTSLLPPKPKPEEVTNSGSDSGATERDAGAHVDAA
jgi:hypothetical protein